MRACLASLTGHLTTYSAFEGFDQDDLVGALHDIREEIRKLPQLHNQLWDLFKADSQQEGHGTV